MFRLRFDDKRKHVLKKVFLGDIYTVATEINYVIYYCKGRFVKQ